MMPKTTDTMREISDELRVRVSSAMVLPLREGRVGRCRGRLRSSRGDRMSVRRRSWCRVYRWRSRSSGWWHPERRAWQSGAPRLGRAVL